MRCEAIHIPSDLKSGRLLTKQNKPLFIHNETLQEPQPISTLSIYLSLRLLVILGKIT